MHLTVGSLSLNRVDLHIWLKNALVDSRRAITAFRPREAGVGKKWAIPFRACFRQSWWRYADDRGVTYIAGDPQCTWPGISRRSNSRRMAHTWQSCQSTFGMSGAEWLTRKYHGQPAERGSIWSQFHLFLTAICQSIPGFNSTLVKGLHRLPVSENMLLDSGSIPWAWNYDVPWMGHCDQHLCVANQRGGAMSAYSNNKHKRLYIVCQWESGLALWGHRTQ